MMSNSPQIVFLDAATVDLGDVDLTPLKRQGPYRSYPQLSPHDLEAEAKGAEILITNKFVLDEEQLQKLSRLKLICVAATGYNNIDLAAAKRRGIAVTHVAGYSTPTVVEHTLMFLLAFSHRLMAHHEAVLNKKWSASPSFALFDFSYSDLAGKILGIIGYGTIGKRVGQLARLLGIKILVAKIPGRSYPASPKRLSLEKVLKQADFVTLHCSLSSKTHHLINSKQLNLMKRTAYLLNMARGPVVNEWAVAEALQTGKIAGYAADVMEQEPPPFDHPFFQEALRNKVLLTPHIAWASRESRQRLVNEIALNIEAFKKGKKRNRIV